MESQRPNRERERERHKYTKTERQRDNEILNREPIETYRPRERETDEGNKSSEPIKVN